MYHFEFQYIWHIYQSPHGFFEILICIAFDPLFRLICRSGALEAMSTVTTSYKLPNLHEKTVLARVCVRKRVWLKQGVSTAPTQVNASLFLKATRGISVPQAYFVQKRWPIA